MPYSVTQTHPDCDGYGVTKDSDGALMGCHQSEDDANKQIAALYAAEADQRAEVILVYGAPCSGKTTLANELAQRGDLILDRDLLYRGISGLDLYDHDLNLSNLFMLRGTHYLGNSRVRTPPEQSFRLGCQLVLKELNSLQLLPSLVWFIPSGTFVMHEPKLLEDQNLGTTTSTGGMTCMNPISKGSPHEL